MSFGNLVISSDLWDCYRGDITWKQRENVKHKFKNIKSQSDCCPWSLKMIWATMFQLNGKKMFTCIYNFLNTQCGLMNLIQDQSNFRIVLDTPQAKQESSIWLFSKFKSPTCTFFNHTWFKLKSTFWAFYILNWWKNVTTLNSECKKS